MDVKQHKSAIEAVFDQAAAEFDQSGVPFFTPLGRRLVERAGLGPGGRVLDIGCGRGSCLFPARETVGEQGEAVGIDISPEMVRHTARAAQQRGYTNVTVTVMDAEDPRLPEEHFDAIVAGFSLMHLPGAPGVLAQYRRLLRPGGRLAFTDLVDDDGLPPFIPPAAFRLLEPYFPSGPNPRERGLEPWAATADSCAAALHNLGFTGVAVQDETFPMVLTSGEQWIDWTMSTGLRAAWDNIPPGEYASVRTRAGLAVEAACGSRRPLSLPVPVRYVVARRPLTTD